MKKNSRGDKTKELLILAAIDCLAEEGLHKVNFYSIGRKAKIAQPLIVYHFKSKENIFPAVWDYLYEKALTETEGKLSQSEDPVERLKNYIQVSIDIFSKTRAITIIYFQLHFLSVFDEKLKQINTKIKRKAINRIAQILMDGQNKKIFTTFDPYLTAKTIHSSLVGILLNSITEFEDFELQQIVKNFENQTLMALKN